MLTICRMRPLRFKQIETLGFVSVTVLALGVIAASRSGAPEWLLDAATAVAIMIALPTMWLNLRRRWWGD